MIKNIFHWVQGALAELPGSQKKKVECKVININPGA